MEGIFLIAGVFLLISVGLPIYLAFIVGDLKRRVEGLEVELAQWDDIDLDLEPEVAAAPEQPEKLPQPAEPAPPQAAPKTAWQPAPKVTPKQESFVFSSAKIKQATTWAQDNWVFILAGVSLALAGVFLVQYGVENGLLSPKMRVLAAIGLGGALVASGEFVRRKAGDEAGHFALLPSVFAGAGLVAVFAGVLSARMLYGLIGADAAFAGLALTGALAVLLGWVYGPLLAVLGVSGALAAPFLVGGNPGAAGPLHLYFALIAAVALLIDAYKRWAWLSALALIGAFGASWWLFSQTETGFHAVLFAFLVALMAVAIPPLALTPTHRGGRISGLLGGGLKTAKSSFPTRVAGGAFLAANVYIWLAYLDDATLFWLVLMVAALLLAAAIFWMKDAPALADLAFAPPVLALAVISFEALQARPVALAWLANATRDLPSAPAPTLAYLLAGAMAASLAFAWRSATRPALAVANGVLAAGFAPWVAIVIEALWQPSLVLGAAQWAIYLAAVAALMVALTTRFAKLDPPENRIRTALFALSSMSMLAFVAVVMLGGVALTLAFAVMVLAAAWLGRRYRLGLLDWYIQLGAVALSFRLVADPGLLWAFDAPLWQVLLAYLGSMALLAVAWWLRRGGKVSVVVVLESAVWTLGGILTNLLLARWLDANHNDQLIFVMVALGGTVWLMLAANQFYRLKAKSRLHALRVVLAALYSGAAALAFAGAVGLNPAFMSSARATGWPIFGSLGAAYLLPALMLAAMGWKLTHLPRALRGGFWLLAAGFASLWVALEIRHFWLGDFMASSKVLKPELYSYTVAMTLAALALLALAYARHSAGLRKLALAVVVLVVAKVYLVDVAELDGLLRAVSVFVLGLLAVVMALVNRWLKANEAAR